MQSAYFVLDVLCLCSANESRYSISRFLEQSEEPYGTNSMHLSLSNSEKKDFVLKEGLGNPRDCK